MKANMEDRNEDEMELLRLHVHRASTLPIDGINNALPAVKYYTFRQTSVYFIYPIRRNFAQKASCINAALTNVPWNRKTP